MTTKTKPPKDKDAEEEEDGKKGSEDEQGDSEDDGDGGDSGDSLENRIKEVVREVVDGLLGERSKTGKSSPAQDEESIRRMVKDAQDKLRKEEEKDSKFKAVSESVESLKKAVEKAPARAGVGGKVSRWLWGSDDD